MSTTETPENQEPGPLLGLGSSEGLGAWLPIATAPQNGTEILAWREDAGCLLVRWISPEEFLTDRELADWRRDGCTDDAIEQQDWFYADFLSGGRLEGDEAPTHWMPLPAGPVVSA